MADPSFHVADYAVFAATILVSLGIGIFYACSGDGQRTTSEYLVGGRSMKFLPVALSMVVSFESSIMMLGMPAETYVYGVQIWIALLGMLTSNLLSAFIVVPLLHPLQITSVYEYLQRRFNSTAVRLLGSILGIVSSIWYMGVVLFGPAIALEAVTGFPQWGSIFVVAGVAVVYTSIGGMKAVIWTDVFQGFIMYAGMLAILMKGTIDVGGPTRVWEAAREGGRLNFLNFDLDPTVRHTFWGLYFSALIKGFDRGAFNQSTVQRISSTSTLREARRMMLLTAPCMFLSLSMAMYEGLVAYAYYSTKRCDPLASKKITNPNQIMPFTMMDIFGSLPGMPGLFLASLFSASLSTLSSSLSSQSAILWTDFLQPRVGTVSEVKAVIIVKISVVLFGAVGCGVAVLVSSIGGPLGQIFATLTSSVSGPLTGLFLLGCFNPHANAKGALFGAISSLVYSCWLTVGKIVTKSIKSEPWLPLAPTDMCLANHSAALIHATTTSSGSLTGVFSDTMLGLLGNGTGIYSTAADFFPTTAEPVIETGPQGIEKMYTLSYVWLGVVGIFVTVILGSVGSLVTGGNKEGEVDPRYLISLSDSLCCCLPKSVKDKLGCGEDHNTAKSSTQPPLHDVTVDKDTIAGVRNEGFDCQDEAAVTEDLKGALPMTAVTDIDKPAPGTDASNLQDQDQNGGCDVRCSSSPAGDSNGFIENGKKKHC